MLMNVIQLSTLALSYMLYVPMSLEAFVVNVRKDTVSTWTTERAQVRLYACVTCMLLITGLQQRFESSFSPCYTVPGKANYLLQTFACYTYHTFLAQTVVTMALCVVDIVAWRMLYVYSYFIPYTFDGEVQSAY